MSSEPDLLAVETIPDADEAHALAEVLADFRDVPAWLTFSATDDSRVCAGQPIEEAVAAVAQEVSAVGINCTAAGHVTGLLERLCSVVDLPLVAYPNHKGVSDGRAEGSLFEQAPQWRARGARLVGGCCGVGAREIRTLAKGTLAPGTLATGERESSGG